MAAPERRAVDRLDVVMTWAREAITIIAAAGAAYMGIRVDLARNQMDIEALKVQSVRLEGQIEKMRDSQIVAGKK